MGNIAYVFKWTEEDIGRLKRRRLLWWNDQAVRVLEEVGRNG